MSSGNQSAMISTIIPAYNAGNFIERAIDSVLKQTIAPGEILVIDDGSQDDTAQRVMKYSAPIRLLRQSNGGPAAARNHGAREARGEWLAFLDADDSWKPYKLETQLPYLALPGVAMVYAREKGIPTDATFQELWRWNFIGMSSVMLRRNIFEEMGGFDEDRALISVEDYNLWLRIAARGYRMIGHPERLHHYTPAEGHLSGQLERMARAELANVEAIGRCLGLKNKMIREKKTAVYEKFGKRFFYYRKLRDARRFLGMSLMHRPNLGCVGRWLATFAPETVLSRNRAAEDGPALT